MSQEEDSAINLDNLQWAMDQKTWLPARLAKESKVNKSTFTLLFKGESKGISAINVVKIARALEVSTDFLLGLTTNPEQKPAMEMGITRIVAIAKTLSEFRQRDLLLMARAYQDADDPTSEMMERIYEMVEEIADAETREKLRAQLQALRASGLSGQGPSITDEGKQEAEGE